MYFFLVGYSSRKSSLFCSESSDLYSYFFVWESERVHCTTIFAVIIILLEYFLRKSSAVSFCVRVLCFKIAKFDKYCVTKLTWKKIFLRVFRVLLLKMRSIVCTWLWEQCWVFLLKAKERQCNFAHKQIFFCNFYFKACDWWRYFKATN